MSRSQRNRGNCFSFICCGCRLRTRDHNEKYLDLPKGWLRQDIMVSLVLEAFCVFTLSDSLQNSSSMEIDVFPNDQSIKIAGPLRCQADRKIACSLISKGALQTSNAQLDTAPTNFVIDSSGKKYRCHGSMSAAFKPVTNRSFRYERFAVTGDDLPSDIDVLIAMSPSDIRKLQNASEAHPSLPIFNNPKTKSQCPR